MLGFVQRCLAPESRDSVQNVSQPSLEGRLDSADGEHAIVATQNVQDGEHVADSATDQVPFGQLKFQESSYIRSLLKL